MQPWDQTARAAPGRRRATPAPAWAPAPVFQGFHFAIDEKVERPVERAVISAPCGLVSLAAPGQPDFCRVTEMGAKNLAPDTGWGSQQEDLLPVLSFPQHARGARRSWGPDMGLVPQPCSRGTRAHGGRGAGPDQPTWRAEPNQPGAGKKHGKGTGF